MNKEVGIKYSKIEFSLGQNMSQLTSLKRNRGGKSHTVTCPKCFKERKVTYSQSWNIKVGKSSGKCQECTTPVNGISGQFKKGKEPWNKGMIGYGKGHPCHYKAFGPNNHNWKGGKGLARGNEYRKWRKKVLERDNYTCQICKIVGVKLQADHIKSWADYPALRHDVSNGRTLCVTCHKETPNYCGRKSDC